MSQLEMLGDVQSIYTTDFDVGITIEQRDRIREWFLNGRSISYI